MRLKCFVRNAELARNVCLLVACRRPTSAILTTPTNEFFRTANHDSLQNNVTTYAKALAAGVGAQLQKLKAELADVNLCLTTPTLTKEVVEKWTVADALLRVLQPNNATTYQSVCCCAQCVCLCVLFTPQLGPLGRGDRWLKKQ